MHTQLNIKHFTTMAEIKKITYLPSNKSGEDLGQQLVVNTDTGTFFQSYRTIIAKVYRNERGDWRMKISEDWTFSKTTKVYTTKFFESFGFGIHCSKDVETAIQLGCIDVIEGRAMTFED